MWLIYLFTEDRAAWQLTIVPGEDRGHQSHWENMIFTLENEMWPFQGCFGNFILMSVLVWRMHIFSLKDSSAVGGVGNRFLFQEVSSVRWDKESCDTGRAEGCSHEL